MSGPLMAGAILAGGRSSRMGADKGLLPLEGRPLVARVLERIRPLFPQVMIVGGDADAYGQFGVPVEADRSPGRGPLGGIHAALRASRFPHVFCIACDMPLADPAVIRHLCSLARDHDVVVPWTAQGFEPLHAVYARDCIPHLERMLQSGRLRVDALYAAVRVRRVGEEELRMLDPTLRGFLNVNTPEELEAARRLLAGESEAPRRS